MTRSQQQAVSAVSVRCQCYKGAVIRGMHFRREKEDRSLKTQDSAVAASFYTDVVPGEEPALRSSYGIIEEVVSIAVAFDPAQIFLKIKWYKQSIVAEDARIRNVPLVKCSGTSSDFESPDVNVSKETVLMRANKIDQQIFFVHLEMGLQGGHIFPCSSRACA